MRNRAVTLHRSPLPAKHRRIVEPRVAPLSGLPGRVFAVAQVRRRRVVAVLAGGGRIHLTLQNQSPSLSDCTFVGIPVIWRREFDLFVNAISWLSQGFGRPIHLRPAKSDATGDD
jgi:hypothetical protein